MWVRLISLWFVLFGMDICHFGRTGPNKGWSCLLIELDDTSV